MQRSAHRLEAARAWAVGAHALDDLPSDRIFVEMLTACRASGGMGRLDTIVRVPVRQGEEAVPTVLQQIAGGAVFSFEWQQVFWVPMFQFAGPDLAPKPAVRQVLGELAEVFDGWSLATWFCLPNCWLKDERPIDLLDTRLAFVLAAARVDRFIASG